MFLRLWKKKQLIFVACLISYFPKNFIIFCFLYSSLIIHIPFSSHIILFSVITFNSFTSMFSYSVISHFFIYSPLLIFVFISCSFSFYMLFFMPFSPSLLILPSFVCFFLFQCFCFHSPSSFLLFLSIFIFFAPTYFPFMPLPCLLLLSQIFPLNIFPSSFFVSFFVSVFTVSRYIGLMGLPGGGGAGRYYFLWRSLEVSLLVPVSSDTRTCDER